MSNSSKRSVVWQFFKINEKGVISCLRCPKVVVASGNTSNLRTHLKNWHPRQYNELLSKRSDDGDRLDEEGDPDVHKEGDSPQLEEAGPSTQFFCETNTEESQHIYKNRQPTIKNFTISSNQKTIQKRLTLPEQKIPSFSKTRWWSLLNLIEVVYKQNTALMTLFQEFKRGKYKEHILNQIELDTLKAVIDVLSPIKNISDVMAGEKYVTGSAILPIYSQIMQTLNALDTNETQLDNYVNAIKVNIIDYLKDRYIDNGIYEFFKKCSFLDPRFKTNEDNSVNNAIYAERINVDPILQKKKKKTGLSAILTISHSQSSTDDEPSDPVRLELNKYILSPTLDLEEDPLQWWQTNEITFPILSYLAKKYLSAQATSVASERVFSRGGKVVTDTRSSLTGEHSQQLIVLSLNKDYVKK